MENIYAKLLECLKTEDRAAIVTSLIGSADEITDTADEITAPADEITDTADEITGPEAEHTVASRKIEKTLVTDSAFFEDAPEIVREAFSTGKPIFLEAEAGTGNCRKLIEPFCKDERLIICGGGHVSLALAEFASKTGFRVTVIDDREEFANRDRFPFAAEVICMDIPAALQRLHITAQDYVVVVTRGHRLDGDCLRALWKEKLPRYIGMIGSRRRVAGLKDQLEGEGIERTWLDRIYTPIGLSIGAVTPEEIGVSILAELIQVKRMPDKTGQQLLHSDVEMEVIEKLAFPPDRLKNQKAAIATIIHSEGSGPRKAGAKMIIYEDGHTVGTIGGGLAEAQMTEAGLALLPKGGWRLEKIDMSHEVAAAEGMACGGKMTVLLEVNASAGTN